MTTKAQTVTVIEPEQAALPAVSESAAILSVIERAARDPAVDIDKMERLMAMHERMLARQAKAAYNAALAEMQPKLPAISQHGEIKHGDKLISKYARWEDIVEVITPILGAHGFALSFRVGRDADQRLITGILSHRGGHSEETTLSLPIDNSGAKNNVQGVGSTTSYGKRYVTQALLNLVSRGEDDDGHAGGGGDLISSEQKAELVDLLKQNGATDPNGAGTKKFLDHMGVASLDEIKAANFTRAKTALQSKLKKSNAAA